MKLRITATKKTLNEIKEKGNNASFMGDSKTLKRVQVILMLLENLHFKLISSTVGISEETIRLWLNNFLLNGIKFLNYKTPPGRPSNLTKSQKKELAKIIDEGPGKFGFIGGCWRTPMVQKIISEKFGILYSCFYLSTLLKNMGYSYQKATFVSAQRDESIRKAWLEKIWPTILKESEKKGSYILFGDECSFSQFGSLSYTWSRIGIQPVVETSGSKKSYKVFGLIDYFTGKLFTMGYEGKLNSDSYEIFLKDVLSKTKKHIILIQDGAKYHTSEDMDYFFRDNNRRLSVYQLPACSPDYNPIEKLWKKMKEKGTHLKYFISFDSLSNKVEELMVDFTNSKEEILSLFGFYDKVEFYNGFKVAV